ncbi:helix-turn-helix domain-containing protein [Sulfoacidibacillus ferrooxidans]|uniref:Helix-turn-helix domain-containing protein n=1 Tax=Sulfoacidibacillus ferrooxidans TaxID=2005001 RepID=A0A9X1VBX2_9BACL|nr:helix-turn-helix domain-containing protein [Sulfoacidibacillus ferrooxidans]MCI0184920.1 hypothetical protein [Sulfoacidibacillus ferrooxidans]
MKNKEKSIIRKMKGKENPYTMVSNSVIRDQRLSWKSRGILVYLLSLPDDWTVHINELTKHAPDGRDSIASGLKELKKLGYVELVNVRDDQGRFDRWEYRVYEDPIQKNGDYPPTPPESENPLQDQPGAGQQETDFPQVDFPLVENPHLLKTDFTNDELLQKTNIKEQQQESLEEENQIIPTLQQKNWEKEKNIVVVIQDEILDCLKITTSTKEVTKWIERYGATYIREKLEIVQMQVTNSPLRALRAAIKDNWLHNIDKPNKTSHKLNKGQLEAMELFPPVQAGKYDRFYQVFHEARKTQVEMNTSSMY